MPTTETALSLFEIEDRYLALLDSADGVTEEQAEEYRQDLAHSFAATVEKRNRVAAFVGHCEAMAARADGEIKRLQKRKKVFEGAAQRVMDYVLWTMRQLDKKKLDADLATFYRKDNPPSVQITDEAAIPARYKTLTITVPAEAWEQHVRDYCGLRSAFYRGAPEEGRMPFLDEIEKTEVSIDKNAIKAAIKGGESILGADLAIGGERVEMR